MNTQSYQHDFRRSRVWAEGWNAARKLSLGQPAQNPYPPGPEHSRWNDGFSQAQAGGKAKP
jgi:hypothetical protein